VKPKEVSCKEANSIIDTYTPIGLFWYYAEPWYIAIDNSTGDCWVEEFETKVECLGWLS
jgi:hypothetical protein